MFLLICASLVPGPSAYLVYRFLASHFNGFAFALSGSAKDIANITASFAYTMMGFLAAVITILFAVTSSRLFKSYAQKGYLSVLFYVYFLTLICLIVTGVLSLLNYSHPISVWWFRVLIMSFVNNLVQIVMVTVMISNLARLGSVQGASNTASENAQG